MSAEAIAPAANIRDGWTRQHWRPFSAGLVIAGPIALGQLGLMSEYQALMLGFGVVYAVAAVGLNILTGYGGQLSLGHAAFLGVGAYTSGWVTWTHEKPFILGLLLAAIVGGLSALVIGFPALRIRGLNLALLTLGFGLAMASMVFRLRAVSGSAAGLPLPRPNINGYILNDNREYLAVALAVLVGALWLDTNLIRTKLGRGLRALREDEDVASSFGVNVARTKLAAFVLSGAMAAAAGSVFGHLVGIAQVESFNFELSVTLLIVVVLGGLGSRAGAVAAGLVFGVLPRVLVALDGWELILGPALVALSLARHSGGMAQHLRELRDRRRDDGPSEDALPTTFRIAAGAEPRSKQVLPPLVIEDLHVRFGGVTAVDGFSFVAPAGEITGIVGPNGAGKTTVFNAVSGFLAPASGRIHIDGTDITALPPHRRAQAGAGRTFQMVGLIKGMSVRDNVLLAQHLHSGYHEAEGLLSLPRARRAERSIREHADAAITALGFDRYADTPLGQLSHGQQRIVEIACVLAARPKVLLLDEPTAGLSPAAAEALADRLREIRDQLGQTIVLIEHHIPFVMATCSTVVVMAAGKELAAGPPAEVFEVPSVVSAYLGEAA